MLLLYVPVLLWQFLIQQWLQRFYVNPKQEKGIHWHGMLLSIAVWPIYFLALVGVLRGKRLTFKVTPKGESLPQPADIRLFIPHMAVGTITTADLLAAAFTHHHAAVMVFWAMLTTVGMFGFAFYPYIVMAYTRLKRVLSTPVRLSFAHKTPLSETS